MPLILPPYSPGMRIGLFGGSFDPTHRGHVTASETARHRLKLDSVWWLATPGNPLKQASPSESLESRINLAEAMTPGRQIAVTGIESAIGSRYTADTVSWLRRHLRAVQLVWIMGADNLVGFHNWQDWRRIAGAVPMAIVDRPGSTLAALSAPAARQLRRERVPERLATRLPGMTPPAWVFLHGPRVNLSSTEIRRIRDKKRSP